MFLSTRFPVHEYLLSDDGLLASKYERKVQKISSENLEAAITIKKPLKGDLTSSHVKLLLKFNLTRTRARPGKTGRDLAMMIQIYQDWLLPF